MSSGLGDLCISKSFSQPTIQLGSYDVPVVGPNPSINFNSAISKYVFYSDITGSGLAFSKIFSIISVPTSLLKTVTISGSAQYVIEDVLALTTVPAFSSGISSFNFSATPTLSNIQLFASSTTNPSFSQVGTSTILKCTITLTQDL